MIGDGMGLAQVSSAFYFKKTPVNFKRFKEIGLINTSTAVEKITDSAAAEPRLAAGKEPAKK